MNIISQKYKTTVLKRQHKKLSLKYHKTLVVYSCSFVNSQRLAGLLNDVTEVLLKLCNKKV